MLAGLFVSIGGLSPNEQKTLREVSAGGVVLHRIDGVWHMAAIEPQRSDDELEKRKGKTVWALPKGLVDPGEKANETATREIREETGVEAELITKLTDIKYVYVRSWGDHAKVFKIVSFFLFRYRAGKLGEIAEDMRKEVRHVEWVPLADAARRLSYSGEKKVAKLAQQWVAEHEGEL
jgi:8-oxo-dGTP pyrophosphatase MutT (NUDIX family)